MAGGIGAGSARGCASATTGKKATAKKCGFILGPYILLAAGNRKQKVFLFSFTRKEDRFVSENPVAFTASFK
jgi:hypothetical protein